MPCYVSDSVLLRGIPLSLALQLGGQNLDKGVASMQAAEIGEGSNSSFVCRSSIDQSVIFLTSFDTEHGLLRQTITVHLDCVVGPGNTAMRRTRSSCLGNRARQCCACRLCTAHGSYGLALVHDGTQGFC